MQLAAYIFRPGRKQMKPLTNRQRKVLRDLAAGGFLLAALNEPDDFLNGSAAWSESVGVTVHPKHGRAYRVRNKTAWPLYERHLIDEAKEAGGLRHHNITQAGRDALAAT